MAIIETKINRFDGGIVNDPRDPSANTCRVATNFDALTNSYKLTPYRSNEDGDSGASTSRKQNFCTALRTGTTYSLYSLGVKSGAATGEVLYKDLTTGASTDLDDNGWSTPSNNQSGGGTTSFELFVYYKKTGLIYSSNSLRYIQTFSPSGAAWADTVRDLTGFSNLAQGLVHSKDDVLYIPYDNIIASLNNTTWTNAAITLPSDLYITSICEYGNYLAIAAAPLSGIGNSKVYLWNRDSSLVNVSENINWGEGILKIIEEINGILVGIMLTGNSTTRFQNRVSFKYYTGTQVTQFSELVDTSSGTQTTILPIAKQKINNRLYFMMSLSINGSYREGVWSVGRSTANISGF